MFIVCNRSWGILTLLRHYHHPGLMVSCFDSNHCCTPFVTHSEWCAGDIFHALLAFLCWLSFCVPIFFITALGSFLSREGSSYIVLDIDFRVEPHSIARESEMAMGI